ncbi:MAG: hypothetical protein LBS01_04685 [Prevotellaceae bacterium]|jgi:DNA modification methylase|nr:hypothetical protein [Prevotellaceae bacterium]
MCVNKLILGDNLEILKTMESETIDLIYLDPPFFSNRNYEVIWGDEGEVRSFHDRWAGGMEHYIAWLKERVEQMHRILKPAGSIFLHCDWHANAEIKVSILNKIFGSNNFKSEIAWKRCAAHNDAKGLGNVKDSIFYYSKNQKQFTFNKLYTEYSEKYISAEWNKLPNDRYYKVENMLDPQNKMTEYDFHGTIARWRMTPDKMEELWNEKQTEVPNSHGRIKIGTDGKPTKRCRIIFLEERKGVALQDIWDDIPYVAGGSKERIGYPTQKPEKLLERIINCASNEGDTVLDPFMGGGTTVAVADRLNRKWIGIDQSVQAVKVTELRLDKQRDLFSAPFTVQLHKYDYDTLRYKNAFEFESFIITQFGGVPQNKKGGDSGVDGKTANGTPVQVKRSDNIGVNVVKNFSVSAKQYNKMLFEKNQAEKRPAGYIIAFSFGKGAIQEIARLKLEENIIIEPVTVDKIVPIAQKPSISVKINELSRDAKGVREIEFIAAGQSEVGIEFYSWDFNYDTENKIFKAGVMLDKTGVQTQKFKAGQYNVAVKVVDNDGLENIEVVKLKVNGTVEKL